MIVNLITTGSPVLNINLSADMLILNAFAINALSCAVWDDAKAKHHRQIRAHDAFSERMYHLATLCRQYTGGDLVSVYAAWG